MRTLISINILFTLLLFTFSANAQSPFEKVPSLDVYGMSSYDGQYATVIYGINTSIFNNVENQVHLSKIRLQLAPQQITNGKILIPDQIFRKHGFYETYNAVVVVIHTEPFFFWRNADNSIPEDGTFGQETMPRKIISISRKKLAEIILNQGNRNLVSIPIL